MSKIKVKAILQQGSSDCASACLATILDYYGKTVSLRKISSEAGTDGAGTSGYGIIKAAQKFGLSCTGIMISTKDKLSSLPLPAILHMRTEKLGHYVVPYRITKNIK